MKTKWWIVLVCLIAFFSFRVGKAFPYVTPTPTPTTSPNGDVLFDKVNKWRIDNKLKPFTKTDRVCDSAKIRLYEIKSDFSHNGFISSRFCNSKTEGCIIGENLAKGNMTEDEILEAWLASPLHRENIEFNFVYSCIVTEGNFVVQHFGSFF